MTGGDSIRDKDRSGVKTQIFGLDLNPAGGSETLMDGQMPTRGGSTEQASLSAGALNADLVPSTDVSNYKWLSLHILTVASGGVITFQGSNDNANWISIPLNRLSVLTATPATSTSAVDIYAGPVQFRFFRARQTSWTSGSTTGVLELYTHPLSPITIGGQVALNGTAAVDTELPAAATIADAATIAITAPTVGAYGFVRDRTNGNMNLITQSMDALNSTGTGIQAAGLMGQFDDVSPTAITENRFGNLRMSANRNLYVTLRDAAGNERGVNVSTNNGLFVDLNTINGGAAVSIGNGTSGTGTQRVTIASDSTGQIVALGNVAAGAADSGNPIKVGGKYNATDVSLSDGNRGDTQLDSRGSTKTVIPDTTASVDLTATGNLAISTKGMGMVAFQLQAPVAWSGVTVVFDATLDDSNWFAVYPTDVTGQPVASISAAGNFQLGCGGFSQVRARVSAYTSGTVRINLRAGIGSLYANPATNTKTTTNALGDGESNTVAVPANGSGTAVYQQVRNQLYNGSTWDRAPGDTTGAYAVLRASTTGGYTKIKYNAQTTTVRTVATGQRYLRSIYVYNPNTSVAYIQLFDVATGTTVTLGTTTPDDNYAIGAGAAAMIMCEADYSLGIKLACTTTATGSTAPTTGLDLSVKYK